MELLNDNVVVKFDENHNKSVKIGDTIIHRPESWLFEELNDGSTMRQKQLDLRQTKPQIAEILVSNSGCDVVKVGDTVFTHFLAYDNSSDMNYEGEDCKSMNLGAIFFKILDDGSFEMMEDNYLGERVYIEEPKTASGIFLTSYGAEKEASKIKITHIPKNSPYISVGDTVFTIDDNQYKLDVLGKKYIKLNTWHIVAKEE